MTTSTSPPANVLSAENLGSLMIASLPRDASPSLESAFDAVALSVHAVMLAVGFRLHGLGDQALLFDADSAQMRRLPNEWNKRPGNGDHTFRYRHPQSSMEFLLKVSSLGPKAVIMGMGLGDDKTYQFEVTVRDYVSQERLPVTLPTAEQERAEGCRQAADLFGGVGRLSDIGSLMRVKVIQKLIPALHKEGYQEDRTSTTSNSGTEQQQRQPPNPVRGDRGYQDPLRAGPRYPLADPLARPRPGPEPIPGFEDEYGILRPSGGMPPPLGGFPRIGDRDLYPPGLGPNDPLRGGIGPGLGVGGGGGGGMHPTFDDPLFQGQRGGGTYDPRAPPGSRYDPVGPFGGQHPRGAGMGGRPPNPFGGFGDGDFI